MKDIAFLLADLWLIVACFTFGWRFIRHHDNWLIGLELMVVGVSGTNFLLWSLLSGSETSPFYRVAYSLDAFSRSFGATLILVVGLMALTHRYKPGRVFDVAIFSLAAVAGVLLGGLHDDTWRPGLAAFYLVMNLLTTCFLAYFAWRVWQVGARTEARLTLAVTALATTVAITYDFFPLSFDDADRTLFYTVALATWGTQAAVYYWAYRALAAAQASEASSHRVRAEVRA